MSGRIEMLKSTFRKIKQNHLLAMILCCAIPLVAIYVLWSMGVVGSWGYYALLLLCPLGHLFLMRGMMNHSDHHDAMAPEKVKEIEYK